MFPATPVQSQAVGCTPACSNANVSVDTSCIAIVTTSMIADTSACPDGRFAVRLYSPDGSLIPDATVGPEHVGLTLKAEAVDTTSGQLCWAYVKIEDKLPPQLTCDCPPVDLDGGELPDSNCVFECLDDFGTNVPTIKENCPGEVDTILIKEIPMKLCDTMFVSKLRQYWVAIDAQGRVSDTCIQELYLKRIDFDSIVWPDSIVVSCSGPFLDSLDGKGDPGPDGCPDPGDPAIGGAGVPTLNGQPLWPGFIETCNAAVDYHDRTIEFGCKKKIMRMWTAYEWHCSGEYDTLYIQLIEVVDTIGPELTCPDDVTITTGLTECLGSLVIPRPMAFDSCNEVDKISAVYPGGFIEDVPMGGAHAMLPVGLNIVKYFAFDECHNVTTCTWRVSVMDETPPVAVCDEHTVVSLTTDSGDGLTLVKADVFDDGSYDECGPVTFYAQRMTSCIDFDWTTGGAFIDNQPDGFILDEDRGTTEYNPAIPSTKIPGVPFACCDVGQGPIMIVVTVEDESGNFNQCMVEVEVQDKMPPVVECPPPITISCEFDFDPEDLSIFGSVRMGDEVREEICIDDPGNPHVVGPQCWGIDGFATDNCGVDIEEFSNIPLDECGIGVITRTFVATDPGDLSGSCLQEIRVMDFTPYCPDSETFPDDTTIIGCGEMTDPEFTGELNIKDDECSLIGFTFEDREFPFVEGACFKILRTWQIIDWCQYGKDDNGVRPKKMKDLIWTPSDCLKPVEPGLWTYQQVIKVIDPDAPEFTTNQDPIEVCNDFDCENSLVELVQIGSDVCTPDDELMWSYQIDAFNDGMFVIPGVEDLVTGIGNTIDASAEYPFGDHRIIYTFEDRCGNKTTREQLFSVISCKPPTPICINGLVADLMPVDNDDDGVPDWGMVTLWAEDFDQKSSDPCDLDAPVVLSFSTDTTDKSIVFDCNDVGQGQIPVELWVTNPRNGEQAFCITYIIIQDNMNACPDDTMQVNGNVISGVIETEDLETVLGVSVDLEGTPVAVNTNSNGMFAFPAMPEGGNYTVRPLKNDDWRNGVTTLDLVRIQKHLLGLQRLTSPYKMIAADANNSGSISAVDLVLLRKLILGVDTEIPGNTSWRFVDADYSFSDPANPFADEFPEVYEIDGLNDDMDLNFIAIKVGDINNTVQANLNTPTSEIAGALNLSVDDRYVKPGDKVEMTFESGDQGEMLGYQFTLNFDNRLLSFDGVEAGALDVTEDNLGLHMADEGKITTSWSMGVPVAVDANEKLFTVTFIARSSGYLSESVSLGSDVTRAESYNELGQVEEIQLTFNKDIAAQTDTEFALLQNAPNPFSQNTVIAFTLPEANETSITVYDLTGRVMLSDQVAGAKGYNEYTLNGDRLNASGVLYYRVQSGDFTATRKMIMMD